MSASVGNRVVATYGPIGHGKSRLVQALTGSTGHVGLARQGQTGFLDVGGQAPLERQGLVGNPGVEIALLCLAVDALRPEVVESIQILDLLPIAHLIIAVTQCDRGDEEMRAGIRQDIADTLAGTRFASAAVVETSAETQEGIDTLRSAIEAIEVECVADDEPEPWFLPIDRAFSVRSQGVVVTGTLARGGVNVGDLAFLEPSHRDVHVRGIQLNGTPAESCSQGQRVSLNLVGLKLEDVRRGMTLGGSGALTTTRAIDSEVRWIAEPKHGQRIRLSIGSEELIGKVYIDDPESPTAQLRLETEFGAAIGQPFVIRGHADSELLGGGTVALIRARPVKKSIKPDPIAPEALEPTILAAISDDPRGVTTEEISKRLGQSPQSMGDIFQSLLEEGKVRSFAGLWMTPEGFAEGTRRFLEALRLTHERHPTTALVPRDRAVISASLGWNGKPLDRLMSEMVGMGLIVSSGTEVRLKEFRPQLPARQRDFLDRVKMELETQPVNVPNPYELARLLGVPPQAVTKILKLGVESGELEQLAEDVFYTTQQLSTILRRTRDLMRGRAFGVGDLKEALGTTRKYIIPLVEHMDEVHFTTRSGDNRVVRR